MKVCRPAMLVLVLTVSVFAWKDIAHYVSLPLIEGSGVYCDVNLLNKAQAPLTKAAAVTDLACLGVNAGLGAFAVFGPADLSPALRKIHRAFGFVTTAAAVFMAVTATTDEGITGNGHNAPIRYVSYGHAALTAVPLVVFAF